MPNTNLDQRIGTKSILGIGGCLLGLAIVYFGYGVGGESPKKEAVAKASAMPANDAKKPVRAANFALDNMVFFARDIGFAVEGSKHEAVDSAKIALRIESQLQRVRELYRQRITKNNNLAGAITLELDISPSGEVSQVKETSSRINDAEFKRDIIAEVNKWSFADLVEDNLKVFCPLLFVHEGMDITTLVQWEKSAGTPKESPLAHGSVATAQNIRTATLPTKPSTAAALKAQPSAPSDSQVAQIKYPTLLRKEPNFNARSLTSYPTGTKVAILRKNGDWLEVRSDNGQTGFIRKEFVQR